jgi:tol-pal system protein YbgF
MKRRLGIALLAIAALWMTRCATTGSSPKPSDSSEQIANVDELLGLEDSGKGIDATETIAEDDVLKLLGVQDQTSSVAPKEAAAGTTTMTPVTTLSAQPQPPQPAGLASMDTQPKTPVWTPPASQAKPGSFAEKYQTALQQYKNRNYRDAMQSFETLLSNDSKNSLSDNCQYWLGECYYGLGNYQQAAVAFEKVFTFSNSNKDDDAQLKLGMCYLKLNDKPKAREELQKLIETYPSSEYVSIARRLLANL